MSNKIDTSEIRRCARALDKCADQVRAQLIRAIGSAAQQGQSAVEGEAGTALENRIEDIKADSQRSERHLSDVAASMYKYADLLDEADRAASQTIKNK